MCWKVFDMHRTAPFIKLRGGCKQEHKNERMQRCEGVGWEFCFCLAPSVWEKKGEKNKKNLSIGYQPKAKNTHRETTYSCGITSPNLHRSPLLEYKILLFSSHPAMAVHLPVPHTIGARHYQNQIVPQRPLQETASSPPLPRAVQPCYVEQTRERLEQSVHRLLPFASAVSQMLSRQSSKVETWHLYSKLAKVWLGFLQKKDGG